jgi:hypothetical protein
VYARPVRQDHHRVALIAAVPKLRDRGRAVGEQALAVSGVDPSARHDLRAVLRADIVLIHLDHSVDGVCRDQALLHK